MIEKMAVHTSIVVLDKFGDLRLKQFTPPNIDVDETDGFEWMGELWISEGIGFTSFYRHRKTPERTGGLEVDFSELPESAILAIFETINLPLRPGMNFESIRSVLGDRFRTEVFTSDRKSYVFPVGTRHRYYVSATVHESDGLIHVAIVRKDIVSGN